MGIAIALSVLFGLALLITNHAGWLATSVLYEDRFVATLAPLPQDEAVSLALAQRTADTVMESFEVTERITAVLPEALGFIAVPLTNGVKDLTVTAATEIIRSDAFTSVWTAALTGSHRIAMAYIGAFDDGAVVKVETGAAVLDLSELGARIAENLDGQGFGLLGGVDRELKVELFELPDSGMISFLANLMNSIRWAVIVLTIGLLIAAFAVATERRRIAIWVGGTAMVAMVVSLVELRYARAAMTGGIEDAVQQAGAQAAWDIILRQFVWQSWAVLLIGALIIFVAWAMGDSAGAASARSVVANTGVSVFGQDGPSPALKFVAAHRGLVELVTAVLIGGFLLVGPHLPIWGVLVTIVLLAVILIGVEYIATSVSDEESAPEPVG